MENVNKHTELDDTDEKLKISDVRYNYYDVEKHCEENGYYKYEYWFPYRDSK
jgi:hypothetical protein